MYVRDYGARFASRFCEEDVPRRCAGTWLTVDGCGYRMYRCDAKLKPGATVFYKARCRCAGEDALYCSVGCCFPYACSGCGRRSCKECCLANANDCCAYCVYASDACDCVGRRHDPEFCALVSADATDTADTMSESSEAS